MASIPLPALSVRPPAQDQQDMVGNYARLLQLKQQMQEQPLRNQILQQQQQEGQLSLQAAQRAQQDDQYFRSALQDPSNQGKTIGQVADALGNAGRISPAAWQQYKKADAELRTSVASLDEKTAGNLKNAYANTQPLFDNAMKTPDDQALAQIWPQVAAQYHAVWDPIVREDPQLQGKLIPLDPNQPMTHQQLQQFGSSMGLAQAYADADAKRREQSAKTAGEEAGAQQKQMSVYAQQLASSPDQATYEQRLDELPHKFASLFPQQFDRQAVLNAGMTPAEQSEAASREALRRQGQQRLGIEQGQLDVARQKLNIDQFQGSTTGADFLATLPTGVQSQVKAIANGDILMPPPGSRAPQAQALRNAVMQYDPTYTDARYKGKQQFKTSGDAQNIMQLSTAMEHADRAIANSPKVGLAPALGHPNLESGASATYMTDVPFLTGEVGKLVKNGELTMDQGNKISSGLTSARQDVRDAALNETMNLLGGKTRALFQKYKNATGQDLPVNEFFDAKSQERLKKYGLLEDAGGGSTGNTGGTLSLDEQIKQALTSTK